MTLSLHIVVDNASDAVLDRSLLYLKRVKQLKYVNIAAGAQLRRGMDYAERVHNEVPNLKIVWRNLEPEDTGILAKMSADSLYRLKVTPYLDWFRRNKIIFMPDNETSGDDQRITTYANQEADILRWLHRDGLNGAMCRFPTGNVGDGTHGRSNQYPLLKPVFDVMLPGDIISPNEYSNAPGKSSAGHLARYKLMWEVAGRPLETVIGEAGISVDYDPGKGYLSIGMSDEAVCVQLLGEEVWYEGGTIDRCIFKPPGGYTHDKFNLRDGILKYLEDYYAKQEVITLPPAQPPIPTYPKLPEAADPRWSKVIAKPKSGNVNVRSLPDKAGNIVALVHPDDVLHVITSEAAGIWIPVKLENDMRGWVSTDVIAFQDAPSTQPEEPANPTITITREEALVLAGKHSTAAFAALEDAKAQQALADHYTELANR